MDTKFLQKWLIFKWGKCFIYKYYFCLLLSQDILWLEKQEGSLNFKFGIIYAKPGQFMDDELLSNQANSTAFNNFLSLIGTYLFTRGGRGGRSTLKDCDVNIRNSPCNESNVQSVTVPLQPLSDQ